MADDVRSPADTSKINLRGGDWYEPPVQQGWSCQKGTPAPAYINSGQVYGHGGTTPYTALYTDGTPPVVTATLVGTLNGGATAYVDTVSLTVTATDAGFGVARIEYKIGSGAWTPYTGPAIFDEVGSYSVQVRASDRDGNTSTPQTKTFAVEASG